MSRILFWLVLIFLVIFAIRSKIRGAQKRNQQQFRQPPPNAEVPPGQRGDQAPGQSVYKGRTDKALADAETMLECAKCGIFFPASEAVHANGRDYCCAAHAAAPAA